MNKEAQENTEKLLIDSLYGDSVRKGLAEEDEATEVEKLTGDASGRRYYRIKNAKTSYVACLEKPIEDEALETDFVKLQRVFYNEGIRVPNIFDRDLNKGYLLEEDLGDCTLLKHLSSLKDHKEEKLSYQKALEELIKIHSIDPQKYSGMEFVDRAFDLEKLMSEVRFTIAQLIEGLFSQELSPASKDVLIKSFGKICTEISKEERVVTHRDYHSRNVMVKNNEFIIIDFQDARMGLPQYDLVSLLEDCYYKISRQNKHDLKVEYWENFLKERLYQPSFESFCVLYDKMTVQRVFKALGSFAYIYRLRGDIRYLKYIGYAFEKLRDVLFRYKEYNDLRVVLSEIYYEY